MKMNIKKLYQNGNIRKEMYRLSYGEWKEKNEWILKSIYEELDEIVEKNGLKMIKDKESYDFFLRMMYEESNGEEIDKNFFE
jgi:hypothetical protein